MDIAIGCFADFNHEIGIFCIKFHFGDHALVQTEKMYNTKMDIFSIPTVEDFHVIFSGNSLKFVDLTTVETPKPGHIL